MKHMKQSVCAFVLLGAAGIPGSAEQYVECSGSAVIKQVGKEAVVEGQFNSVGEVSKSSTDMVEANLACKPAAEEFKKLVLYYKRDKTKGPYRAKFDVRLLSYAKCDLVKQAMERGGFTFPLANSSTVSAFQEVVAVAPPPTYFANAWRDLEEHLSGRACRFGFKKLK